MAPSPPRPRREPRRLDFNAARQASGGLEIRVVPYSPPRISSGTSNSASVSSRPLSYDESSPSSLPTLARHRPYAVEKHADENHEREQWVGQDDSPSAAHSSRLTNAAALYQHDADNASNSSLATSRASSPRPPSSRHSRRIISLNSDNKTFSLHPISGSATSRSESLGSSLPHSTTPSSSWGRVSSNNFVVDDRAGSPLTPLSERRFSTNSPNSLSAATSGPGPATLNSWNNRLRGGMRRIEPTPDRDNEVRDAVSDSPVLGSPFPLPALSETSLDIESRQDAHGPQLLNKDSFQSSHSTSTLSERTNYKVYGQSSPVASSFVRQATTDVEDSSPPYSLPPSSSNSNYQIHAASSDIHLPDDRPFTGDSDANYVVHGGPSASCSSLAASPSRLRSEYSQESLVVPPLRPVKKRSFERSSALKSRSRESLRRGSLSSLSSTLSHEATRALITGSFNAYTQGGIRKHQPWNSSPNPMPLGSHPHHWSAPLSTVMSESDRGSAPPSRSLSAFSGGDRRGSNHSRHVLSISSSLLGLEAHATGFSQSRVASLEPPPPALGSGYPRDLGNIPRIRDHDEYGDGLADLENSHQRPSRARLASSASNPSERYLRSSGSSRSLNMFSFPGWARLYYGSDERRFLIAQASSESIRSLYNGSLYNENAPLPPVNQSQSRLNRSPSAEQFMTNIRNPRRRPRGTSGSMAPGTEESLNIVPDPIQAPSRTMSIARRVRKQTSSIWSPHLYQDKRASSYSMWEPRSAPWSSEHGSGWKRNRQIILFVMGFLIPFAWMVAAFLPLPSKPVLDMVEQQYNHSTTHLDLASEPAHRLRTLDEAIYSSARWWRNLNRVMSAVGLLVIGAIIALVVVGVKEQWGS